MLPAAAQGTLDAFIARLDRALPGRVEGFYLVGSAAFGAFRPGRSDLDFVAVMPGGPQPGDVDALRRVHRASCAGAALAVAGHPWRRPLLCKGSTSAAGTSRGRP